MEAVPDIKTFRADILFIRSKRNRAHAEFVINHLDCLF